MNQKELLLNLSKISMQIILIKMHLQSLEQLLIPHQTFIENYDIDFIEGCLFITGTFNKSIDENTLSEFIKKSQILLPHSIFTSGVLGFTIQIK